MDTRNPSCARIRVIIYDRCHDLAVKTFRYAIQLEPNFPDAYNNLGNALRESGQLEVGPAGGRGKQVLPAAGNCLCSFWFLLSCCSRVLLPGARFV